MSVAPTIVAPSAAAMSRIRHSRYAFIIILAVIFGSRLSFLSAGFGADPDAWLVANAARQMAETGEYVRSRPPGYPVLECAAALVSGGGPVVLNGLTALLSTAAAGFFMAVLRQLGCKSYLLAGLALALTPVVFINSTNAMDYVWALAFILAAYYFVLSNRPLTAGFLLGVATGCRSTSALMLLPLAAALHGGGVRRRGRKSLPKLGAAWLLVSFVAYLPVVFRYGEEFLTYFEPHDYPDLATLFSRVTLRMWGLLGTISVAVAVIHHVLRGHPTAGTACPTESVSRQSLVALLALLIYCAVFLRFPLEEGYLIPIVPFVFILLARILSIGAFKAVCVTMCFSPWFFYLGRPPTTPWSGYSDYAMRIGSGDDGPLLDPLRGPILRDHVERLAGMRYVKQVVELAKTSPRDSVIVVGYWLPQIRFNLAGDERELERFAYLVSRDELDRLNAERKSVLYLPETRELNLDVYGLDLREAGGGALEVYIDHER